MFVNDTTLKYGQLKCYFRGQSLILLKTVQHLGLSQLHAIVKKTVCIYCSIIESVSVMMNDFALNEAIFLPNILLNIK